MVLAHNEQHHIEACLDSVFAAERGHLLEIFVMANGCTDATEEIVSDYAQQHSGVHLVSIALGDKCNAWNTFVHQMVPQSAPDRECYFFVNGDARVAPGSFKAMADALRATPYAHAASAVPESGRNAERDRRRILEEHGLVANLYALRGNFVARLQREGVRIPLKMEGDDGLIGALIKFDLDPRQHYFDHARIVPCADARFGFESMSLTRPADWRAYWKRAVRYGRSRYEFQLLRKRLLAEGIEGLPEDIREVYADAASLDLIWNGLYTLPSWVALRSIRRLAQEHS